MALRGAALKRAVRADRAGPGGAGEDLVLRACRMRVSSSQRHSVDPSGVFALPHFVPIRRLSRIIAASTPILPGARSV